MILPRRQFVLGGTCLAGTSLLLPSRLMAQALPVADPVPVTPGAVPRVLSIQYASSKGITRAEVGIMRGVANWERTLPAAMRGNNVAVRVAERIGAKFVAGRVAAMAIMPWIPVAGWVVEAGLVAWTAYDIYRAKADLDAADAIKIRPQSGSIPFTPPTSSQNSGVAPQNVSDYMYQCLHPKEFAERGYGYHWDMVRQLRLGAFTSPPGLPTKTVAFALMPAPPAPERYYRTGTAVNGGPNPTTLPKLTGNASNGSNMPNGATTGDGFEMITPQGQRWGGSFGASGSQAQVDAGTTHWNGQTYYWQSFDNSKSYTPILPSQADWPAIPVSGAGNQFPPGTVINPNLLAGISNNALTELHAENPSTFPHPATYPLRGSDFDTIVTGQDLGEPLQANRPRAMSPTDPVIQSTWPDLLAPNATPGNVPAPVPFPGSSSSTGTPTPSPSPSPSPSETAPEIGTPEVPDWSLLPKPDLVTMNVQPAACPPIVLPLGSTTTMHCTVSDAVTPTWRTALGAVAPLITFLGAMGRGGGSSKE